MAIYTFQRNSAINRTPKRYLSKLITRDHILDSLNDVVVKDICLIDSLNHSLDSARKNREIKYLWRTRWREKKVYRTDTIYVAVQLDSIRTALPDTTELNRLTNFPHVEAELVACDSVSEIQSQLIARQINTISTQGYRVERLEGKVSDLSKYPRLYIEEKCKVGIFFGITKRGWISGDCIEKEKKTLVKTLSK